MRELRRWFARTRTSCVEFLEQVSFPGRTTHTTGEARSCRKQQDRRPPRIGSTFLGDTLRNGFALALVTVRVVIVVVIVVV